MTNSCGRNSVVECQLPKLDVGGSNPLARFVCQEMTSVASWRLSLPTFHTPKRYAPSPRMAIRGVTSVTVSGGDTLCQLRNAFRHQVGPCPPKPFGEGGTPRAKKRPESTELVTRICQYVAASLLFGGHCPCQRGAMEARLMPFIPAIILPLLGWAFLRRAPAWCWVALSILVVSTYAASEPLAGSCNRVSSKRRGLSRSW